MPSCVTFSNITFKFTFDCQYQTDQTSKTITITLKNGVYVTTNTFTANIYPNTAPVFICEPEKVFSVYWSLASSVQYQITNTYDKDGDAVQVPALLMTTPLPVYITYNQASATFTINPPQLTYSTQPSLGQSNTVSYYLSDGYNTTGPYLIKFYIDANPRLTANQISSVTMSVGQTNIIPIAFNNYQANDVVSLYQYYYLGTSIANKLLTIPSYVTYDSTSQSITLAPSFGVQYSNFTALLLVQNSLTSATFTQCFNIMISNANPVVSPTNQQVVVAQSVIYTVSSVDPEGGILTLQMSGSLPNYITRNGFTFTFSPSYSIAAQTLTISFQVSDGINTVSSQFNLTVINKPPIFTPILLTNQIVIVNTSASYTLPAYSDPEGYTPVSLSVTASTLPNFITWSLANKQFSFTQNYLVPPQTINIEIILSDSVNINKFNLRYQVINTLPHFITPLVNQSVKVGQSITYNLPNYVDDEGATVTYNFLTAQLSYESRIGTSLTYSPSFNQAGATVAVTIQLNDQAQTASYSFYLTVINTSPFFFSTLVNQTVPVGQTISYSLPNALDNESPTVAIQILTTLPHFISYNQPSFTISPLFNETTQIIIIKIQLSDSLNLKFYYLQISVTNTAPSIATALQDQVVSVGSIKTYQPIGINDPENGPISIIITSSPKYYISVSGTTFTFSPGYNLTNSSLVITFNLTDGVNKVPYSFNLQIINTNPYLSSLPANQTLNAGQVVNYALPTQIDLEGAIVTVSQLSILPSFVQFFGQYYIISPPYSLQSQTINVTLQISDGILFKQYFFTITIINQAPYIVDPLIDQTVGVGFRITYTPTNVIDPENGPLSFVITNSVPSYISVQGLSFVFTPDVYQLNSTIPIQFSLSDGANIAYYSFSLTIVNILPQFISTPDTIQLKGGQTSNYQLPQTTGLAGAQIVITVEDGLPQYGTFSSLTNSFTFSPTYFDCPDQKQLILGLFDGGIHLNYTIDIMVVCPEKPILFENKGPPTFNIKLKNIQMGLGDTIEYKLPAFTDPDNDKAKIKVSLDSIEKQFILYSAGILNFRPVDPSNHVGSFQINITLKDDNKIPLQTQYIFSLTVSDKNQNITMINTNYYSEQNDFNSTQNNSQSQNLTQINFFAMKKGLINQKGKLFITMNATIGSQIVNNQTFQIKLIKNGGMIDSEVLNFTSNSDNSTSFGSQITLQIRFKNPSLISTSQDLDQIEITCIQNLQFQQGEAIYQINKGNNLRVTLPPQYDGDNTLLESLAFGSDSVQNSKLAFLASNIAINIAMSSVLSLLWKALSDLSSLMILFLIAVPIQGLAQALSSTILSLAQMDVLPTDQINNGILDFNSNDDNALSPYFQLVGIQSTNLIQNMGSTFIYMIGEFILILLIGIVSLLNLPKFQTWLQQKLIWNHFLRFIMQQYVTMYLAGLVNLYQVQFSLSGDKTATLALVLVLGICMISPIVMFGLIISYQRGKISENKFNQYFGTLTQDLNTNNMISSMWNVITIIKWQATVTILVTFKDIPTVQITSIYFIQVFVQSLLVKYKPFKEKSQNLVALINEILVSTTIILFLCSSDITNDLSLKQNAGLILVGVIGFSCVVNLGNFAIRVLIQVYSILALKYKLWKLKNQKNRVLAIKPFEQQTQISIEDNDVSHFNQNEDQSFDYPKQQQNSQQRINQSKSNQNMQSENMLKSNKQIGRRLLNDEQVTQYLQRQQSKFSKLNTLHNQSQGLQ